MKKLIFILFSCLLLFGTALFAQVAINTSGAAPDNSAMLDISSTTKGFLIPRMDGSQMVSISNPVAGLLVYNTSIQALYNYNGTAWNMLKAGNPSILSDADGNTTVDVEFSPNNDMIYFRLAGSTKMILKGSRLELLNDYGNTFIGQFAGQTNNIGSYNSALGVAALYANYFGSGNTAVGFYALSSNINSSDNSAFGSLSLAGNTSGTQNTANGANSLRLNATGSYNTASGFRALYHNTASDNSAFGKQALHNNTVGYQNTSIGSNALYSNMDGYNNTAIGYGVMQNNLDGSENTAGGVAALYYNASGNNNSAFGREALRDNNADNNTAVGFHAAQVTSTGFQNVAVGANSLVNNSSGSYNTAIGYNTGPNGSNLMNTTCLGIDATATGHDMVRIGNIYVGSIGGNVGWTTLSDGRFKENVSEDIPGLSFINQLRPVKYQVNRSQVNDFIGVEESYSGMMSDNSVSSRDNETWGEVTTGFIAQEVEAAARTLGFEFSGVDAPNNENDVYGLRYAEFVVPLVKAVQEQQAMIDSLQQENHALRQRLENIESLIIGPHR